MSDASESSKLPTHDEIEMRAAELLGRQRFWAWSTQDEEELSAWLDESVIHRVTYLRLAAAATRIERLAALRRPQTVKCEAASTKSGPLRRLMISLIAGAASIALIALGGVAAVSYLLRPQDRSFATDVGGHALLKFADGTQVELNTDTAIRYRMTTQERTVWLDRGEAYFRVAHDATHPFVVVSGNRRVTDLGTEFLARSGPNAFEVSLVSGRARLGSDEPDSKTTLLAPGDDAVATADSLSVVKKTPQEISDALAWQRGVVVFRHEPLAEAVEQFNRYNRTKLVVADDRAANLRVGGEFRTDNLADFLQLAELVLKLHVENRGAEIWLSSQPAQRGRAAPDSRG